MGHKAANGLATGHLEFDFTIHTVPNDQVGELNRAVIEFFRLSAQPACKAAVKVNNAPVFIEPAHPDRQAFDHLISMLKSTLGGGNRQVGRHFRCLWRRKGKALLWLV